MVHQFVSLFCLLGGQFRAGFVSRLDLFFGVTSQQGGELLKGFNFTESCCLPLQKESSFLFLGATRAGEHHFSKLPHGFRMQKSG